MSTAAFLLGILLIVLLTINFRGLRTAIPRLRSGNIGKAALSWIALIFTWLLLVGVLAGGNGEAPPSRQAAVPAPTAVIPAATAAPTVTRLAPTATTAMTGAPVTGSPTVAGPSPSPTAPAAPPTAVSVGIVAKVVEVVDGDTIKVSLAGKTETVRVIGIDTPEVVDPREPVQCFGREASAKAKELLSGQQVRLVSDPTQGDRDKYNRLLRYVDLADGTDFGLWMVANGYAHEYTYNIPYQRQAQYKAAYREAREKSLGFWAPETCGGDTKKPAGAGGVTATPTPPPRTSGSAQPVGSSCPEGYPIKGNLSSSGEKIYHVPVGQFYDRTVPEACFATEADAQAAGFRRSLR